MEDEIRQRFEDNEKRISGLEAKLYGSVKVQKSTASTKVDGKVWYKPNGTVAKLVGLLSEKFFDTPKTLNETVVQFTAKDYHFKPSDLTLPVRQCVRHGLMRREKKGKKWAYVKV